MVHAGSVLDALALAFGVTMVAINMTAVTLVVLEYWEGNAPEHRSTDDDVDEDMAKSVSTSADRTG